MLPLLWPLGLYALMAPSGLVVPRYLLPIYPVLAAFAALGLDCLLQACRRGMEAVLVRGESGTPDDGGAPRSVLAAAGLVLLLASPARDGVTVAAMLAETDTRLLARQWILEHLPRGARVAREFYAPPLLEEDGFEVLEEDFSLSDTPLRWYCDYDWPYLLISSRNYAPYFEDDDPRFAPQRRWYRQLRRRARLLKRFPGREAGEHHPTVEVYLLYCPD